MRNTKTWPAWLACAAMALLIAGCGGGGGSSGAASPTTASAAADTTPVKYSVTLTMTSGQVGVGRSISMSASVVDSKGADVTSSSTFAWTSSSNAIATVVPAANGGATITGVAVGTATIQVVATVKAADNSTTQLPAQTASVAVQPTAVSYNLALSNPVLSLVDGQVQPVKATLVDGNGSDVSAAVHDWAWASSISNVQVSAAQNAASLTGVNSRIPLPRSARSRSRSPRPMALLSAGRCW
ncbi:hypothetical protein [Cupriavidus basilensis]|uniref:hypothetical protein n=1 Tax=Cupriavidus basilensis TaxID=68895 RepID=UPI0039F6EE36